MLTLFNTYRTLTRIAADAAHIAEMTGTNEQPWRRASIAPSHNNDIPPAFHDENELSSAERLGREQLEHLIEVAVVGDPNLLGDVLTPDATGWSPTLRFTSRSEAVSALDECHTRLSVPRSALIGSGGARSMHSPSGRLNCCSPVQSWWGMTC